MKKAIYLATFLFCTLTIFSCTNDEDEEKIDVLTPSDSTQTSGIGHKKGRFVARYSPNRPFYYCFTPLKFFLNRPLSHLKVMVKVTPLLTSLSTAIVPPRLLI